MNSLERQKLEEISQLLYNTNFFICNNKVLTEEQRLQIIDTLGRCIRQMRTLTK